MHLQLYTPGRWAAGTQPDIEAMRAAALPCWVWRMRRHGRRLPAHQVDEPLQADLLAINRYGETSRFLAKLLPPGQLTDSHWEMHGARVERAGAGVMLLRGDEWDPGQQRHWDQTWMCTSTQERGLEILARMSWRKMTDD